MVSKKHSSMHFFFPIFLTLHVTTVVVTILASVNYQPQPPENSKKVVMVQCEHLRTEADSKSLPMLWHYEIAMTIFYHEKTGS